MIMNTIRNTKVYILNLGKLECDENWMVAMSTVATKDNKNVATHWVEIPVYAVLIDHPEGKILFDLGCHPQASEGHWCPELVNIFPFTFAEHQRLENQLKLVNIRPEDITTVILSHMHLDHIGNIDLFKHAEVYVSRKEFEYAQTLVHSNQDPKSHGAYIKSEVVAPVKCYHLLNEDTEIFPGIEFIALPGHTAGSSGLIVHLEKEGVLIFPMDAIYNKTVYGPPARASGLVYDSIAFFKSIERVRSLAKKYQAQVMFSHDMAVFENMKKAPDYYF
jgi:glyoxylase-like metal-dependent hydrolase (beta-lactamase superfamily II)